MIRAAHEAFHIGRVGNFHFYRLSRDRENNEVRAVSYDEETLGAALEAGFEVR